MQVFTLRVLVMVWLSSTSGEQHAQNPRSILYFIAFNANNNRQLDVYVTPTIKTKKLVLKQVVTFIAMSCQYAHVLVYFNVDAEFIGGTRIL